MRLVVSALALTLYTTGLGAQSSYLTHDQLTRELRSLANGSPLASLTSIGKSTEGRDIWMVTIGRAGGAPMDTRPGLMVVGNLSGDHVAGSALALRSIRYLLSDSGQARLGDALTNNVIYVVPRLNPDGTEGRRRTNGRPVDWDNDGRMNEDGPEDLNGDGFITVMRVPDPAGDFTVDTAHPRLMRRADRARGQGGGYALYVEGRDDDGDGFYNEDGPGGVDLDRNFQHAYPYWERDAGPWMISEPETRALMDFMIAHRNVAAIFQFGLSDNLVTPPNDRGQLTGTAVLDMIAWAEGSNTAALNRGVFRTGGGGGFGFGGGGSPFRGAQPGRDNDSASGRRPSTTVHRNDRDYWLRLSQLYKDITGISKVGFNREAEGAFFQWGYFHFGVPSFSSPGWGHARTARDSSLDITLLTVMDTAGVDGFVPWTPYTHPQLGQVEIGGFKPLSVINPPDSALDSLGVGHGRFLATLATMLPRVRIAGTEVTAHGGGVFTVKVTVENAGYFPTALQHGLTAGAVDATTVQIQVPPETILTGADKTHRIRRLDGSGGREEVSWVIRGQPGARVEIRVRAQKGGTATTTVTLR